MVKKISFLLLLSLFLLPYGWTGNYLRVIEVLDGDSIVLSNGEEVRYVGIDAPEYGQPYAEEAKEFNRKLVKGKIIRLEFDIEKRDRYGRLLAYVYTGNILVNAELVKKGFASIYTVHTVPPNVKYKDLFLKLQNKARKDKRGLWSKRPEDPEAYYIASKKSTKFHRPWCRWAKKIRPWNQIKFKSRDEALDKGLSPCKVCNP
jgi:micrococcal nuclease